MHSKLNGKSVPHSFKLFFNLGRLVLDITVVPIGNQSRRPDMAGPTQACSPRYFGHGRRIFSGRPNSRSTVSRTSNSRDKICTHLCFGRKRPAGWLQTRMNILPNTRGAAPLVPLTHQSFNGLAPIRQHPLHVG